jgi:hypothetical protein
MTDANAANPETGAVTDVTSAAAAFKAMNVGGSLDETPKEQAQAAPAEDAEAPKEAEASEVEAPEGETQTDSSDSEAATSQPQEEPLYTVKIDGKEERVTLKELLSGYQKDADYRRKTASLSEERKAVEAEKTQAAQERQHYQAQLQALIPMLHTQLQDKFANVDWVKLAKENPSEYVTLKAEYDAHAQRLQMAVAERERIAGQQRAETEKQRSAWLAEQETRLVAAIPDWKDQEKGRKGIQEIYEYLIGEGVPKDLASQTFDAVHLLIARKAMLYDRAQKAKQDSAAKVVKVPQVQRPGTPNKTDPKVEARKEALSVHRKHGTVDSAADAFRKMKVFG